jgi:hypothetical protein
MGNKIGYFINKVNGAATRNLEEVLGEFEKIAVYQKRGRQKVL